LNRVVNIIERIVGSVGVIAALLLVPLVLATTWEVVSRYALNAPTIWAYEIGYLLTGSHFLLGLAYTLRQGEHIRIDVFTTRMSPATRRRIDAVAYVFVLPLLVWLTYALFGYFSEGQARGETSGQSALNLPVWPFRMVFVISFAVFSLQVFCELMKSLRAPAPNDNNNPAAAS
jgi:TRAP-type mannitol/chloroaromatic compound transport system permease small subunit